MSDLASAFRSALTHPLDATDFSSLGDKYEGKVRDCYRTADGRRFLVVTDRISAFDRVLGTLPLKGQMLNQMAAHWFSLTRDLVPNHVRAVPDPNVMEAIECTPLPVEFVMRAFMTGVTSTSLWTHYAQGERIICGHRLPDGLRKNQKLPRSLLTPSTKAPKGSHDVSVSKDEILAAGHITEGQFDRAEAMAQVLFAFGQTHCEKQGLLLVDTKYEFGTLPSGEMVVIDEIHTPDSSRFWFADSYEAKFAANEEPESFDKEFVRRWLSARGFVGEGPLPVIPDEVRVEAALRYAEAFARITGHVFQPNLEPPLPRIRAALGLE